MKRTVSTAYLLLLSLIAFSQTIDQSAATSYFQLTDSLRKNLVVSEAGWRTFFNLKGNALYIANKDMSSRDIATYRKNIEIVYMPKHDSLLKARLKEPETYFYTYVINRYKEQEAEFKRYLADIEQHQEAYLKSIYANTFSMLPAPLQKRAATATLYFIPVLNDAVAEGNDIILSVYCGYYFDKVKRGALGGHEVHHLLRKNKQRPKTADSLLYTALTRMVHEGSADLIDKRITEAKGFPDDLRYSEYMLMQSAAYVARLDTAILKPARQVHRITKADVQQLAPMSGHIPGYYMALVIERNGLKQELVNAVTDPVAFVLLYNKAARKDKQKAYVLSAETIAYLQTMKGQ